MVELSHSPLQARDAENLLARAYQLVLRGWCQGADARDERGLPVEAANAAARRWSASGALTSAWQQNGDPHAPVSLDAFAQANLAVTAVIRETTGRWNDEDGRTQRDVLDAFSQAMLILGPGSPDTPSGLGSPPTRRNGRET